MQNYYMKKIFTLAAAAALFVSCASAQSDVSAPSDVYFTSEITPQSLVRIFEALGVQPEGNVAVKISTGESEKSYHLRPELIKDLVQSVNGTIVESNTAYGGNRGDTETHRKTIEQRGYGDIAKVDILDGEGTINIPVEDTTHIKYDIVGSHLADYDFMINLAHFKGHAMGGFGGVLKNQSIGIASSEGKTYIHTAGVTSDMKEFWNHVDNQDGFLESMASAAQGVHNYFKQPGKNIVYINVMNNMSVDCDCNGNPHSPELLDMGVMASLDPVALDRASLDMVFNHESSDGDDASALIERINSRHGVHTVEYAEKLGLGTQNYNLINIDKK